MTQPTGHTIARPDRGSLACLGAILLAMAIFLLVYLWYNRTGLDTHIIVPTHFRGPVHIIDDARGGKDIRVVNGRYEYVIPPDGVLRVKTLEPFYQWHNETAAYADGTPLPVESLSSGLKDADVALRGGGVGVGSNHPLPTIFYFVGTQREHEKHEREHLLD